MLFPQVMNVSQQEDLNEFGKLNQNSPKKNDPNDLFGLNDNNIMSEGDEEDSKDNSFI